MSSVLAFDFGASSGRAILGTLNDKKITLKEVHRFSNDPVMVNGTFYWDILRLYHEIKQGIIKALNEDENIKTMGIDTWGVDFGLIDDKGNLLQNPVHYRDARTDGIPEKLFKIISAEEIYDKTGIQFLKFNTIFQLYALKKQNPKLLENCHKLLFIPDLFNFFLTGKIASEYSIASTSALLSPDGAWEKSLLEKMGVSKDIFTDIVLPGNVLAPLSDDICKELGIKPVDVVNVCEHDTGSAVVSVPALDEDFIYLSCGTWSLMGLELKKPLINKETLKANITNEGGYNKTSRFLKNIIGLWLMQESKRFWEREGASLSFNDINDMASEAEPFKAFVNPSDDVFIAPGNMPERIMEYCKKTGQIVPETKGEIARCILESLALEYARVAKIFEGFAGKEIPAIHLVGGGVQNKFLCRLTANASGKKVIVGPVEATAIGNIAVQLMSQGLISDIKEARKIIMDSFPADVYLPEETKIWEDAYKRYIRIIEKEVKL